MMYAMLVKPRIESFIVTLIFIFDENLVSEILNAF